MINRLVDQLVRHAVKAHMTSQRYRTSTLALKIREFNIKKKWGNQAHDYRGC